MARQLQEIIQYLQEHPDDQEYIRHAAKIIPRLREENEELYQQAQTLVLHAIGEIALRSLISV